MFGSREAQEARTLIIQHMRDCEIDKKEIKDALRIQNDASDDKHAQNIGRLAALDNKIEAVNSKIQSNYTRLMLLICATLLTMIGGMAMEIIKEPSAPSASAAPQASGRH